MISVCIYDLKTGVFKSRWTGSPSQLEGNIPAGCGAIEGPYDLYSQKVDLATQQVVDYQPPAPDEFHEWDSESKRWKLKSEIEDARMIAAAARSRIEELEGQQARRVRELLMQNDERLSTIDAEISKLRAKLSA